MQSEETGTTSVSYRIGWDSHIIPFCQGCLNSVFKLVGSPQDDVLERFSPGNHRLALCLESAERGPVLDHTKILGLGHHFQTV